MKKHFFSLFLMLPFVGLCQVGVGTNNVDPSAKFQIESSNKGFLQPRIALTGTTDVVTIASPATGLMVYNTATAGSGSNAITPGVHYFDGARWVRMQASVINAGTGTSVTGTGTSASPYVINSTSGSSSPTALVVGEYSRTGNSAITRQTSGSVLACGDGYSIIPAMRLGAITLPAGKWEVHVRNFAENDSYGTWSFNCSYKMMYWLQNNDSTYNIAWNRWGLVINPNQTQCTTPPLNGGDTLFTGSANFIQGVHPANPYNTGSFFINNSSGANKTYYLYASEVIICPAATIASTSLLPSFTHHFGNKNSTFNRFYATKIE
jgi:hypothetical protein